MKHYKMRAVFRDANRVVTHHGKPRTFPKAQALYMLEKYPADWEVLDPECEVPDDWRASRRQAGGMTPANSVDDLKARKPAKLGV